MNGRHARVTVEDRVPPGAFVLHAQAVAQGEAGRHRVGRARLGERVAEGEALLGIGDQREQGDRRACGR